MVFVETCNKNINVDTVTKNTSRKKTEFKESFLLKAVNINYEKRPGNVDGEMYN